MGKKYINIFDCKTLKFLPKFGFHHRFFGLKIYHLATPGCGLTVAETIGKVFLSRRRTI
jgi:hypothetical protein